MSRIAIPAIESATGPTAELYAQIKQAVLDFRALGGNKNGRGSVSPL